MKILVDGHWLSLPMLRVPMDALHLRQSLEEYRHSLDSSALGAALPPMGELDADLLLFLHALPAREHSTERRMGISNDQVGYWTRSRGNHH